MLTWSHSRKFAAGLAFLALTGCATYQTQLSGFRQSLKSGDAQKAAQEIKQKAETDSDDQVVYLFEYATAEQIAQNYDASTKAFLKAEDLTEVKDYHSISRIAGSLVLSEGMKQYKGDDYEKVLINAMLAINFLMEGKYEEARVECRKLNDKLYKYRFEGKRNYQQNPFAFYLSGLIWEANKDWDSAYIDFKKAYELNPSLEYLREDLIRAGIAARRGEDVAAYKKQWPDIQPADLKNNGEVILIYQQGWGPLKRPHPNFPRIPKLYPSFSETVRAQIEVEGGATEPTQVAVDITDTAMKQLDEQYAGLIAMRAAGIATKAVVADQIRQKNELLGQLAWIGMNIADQADLRQWLSLPASIQVAKVRLKPGKYRIRVTGLNRSGSPSGEGMDWQEVTVQPRRKKFIAFRSLR